MTNPPIIFGRPARFLGAAAAAAAAAAADEAAAAGADGAEAASAEAAPLAVTPLDGALAVALAVNILGEDSLPTYF